MKRILLFTIMLVSGLQLAAEETRLVMSAPNAVAGSRCQRDG